MKRRGSRRKTRVSQRSRFARRGRYGSVRKSRSRRVRRYSGKRTYRRRSRYQRGGKPPVNQPGNDVTYVKSIVPSRRKRTVSAVAEMGVIRRVVRFNRYFADNDVPYGSMNLGQVRPTISTIKYRALPIHIYDMTQFPCNTASVPAGWYFYVNTATGDITRANLTSVLNTGTGSSVNWQNEKGQWVSGDEQRKVMHDWSDVRLQLYGPTKTTTRFTVTFFTVNNDFANPGSATTTNVEFIKMMDWFTYKDVYNPLVMRTTDDGKKIRIVKRFTYYVGAYDSGQASGGTNRKVVRIFMRHNKLYNLDWQAGTMVDFRDAADAGEYVANTTFYNYPHEKARLFMAIQAQAVAHDISGAEIQPWTSPVDIGFDPTYDILARNAFTCNV